MKLLKYTIPLGIIAAGALSLSGCYLAGAGSRSGAVTAACNGFRQWQRSHDPATLSRATKNLDQWALGDNLPEGGRYGSSPSYVKVLDDDMDFLNAVVQGLYPSTDMPAASQYVVNDCKRDYGGGGAPHGSTRLVSVFMVTVGLAVLIVVTALALWIGYSIKYRACK